MTSTTNDRREKRIHELFEIGILLKGANALVQLALGVAILLTSRYVDVLVALVQNELVEDPGDFFANNAQGWLQSISQGSLYFASFYLLSHGVVKLVLVWGLWKDRIWAYPASLAVLALFVLYQVIRWLSTHSVILLLLTVFDLVVIWLIYHEYRLRLAHRLPKD